MKIKHFFALGVLALSGLAHADNSTIANLLIINDIEYWAEGGKSLFNWEEFADKDMVVNSNVLSPIQVYYEFKRNVFTAEDKYTKNMQVVYGGFQSVEKDNNGMPVVVFDVNYGNHIYIHGLAVREAQFLDVAKPIKMLCTNFKMDRIGDLSATCSQLINKSKFISSLVSRQAEQILKEDSLYKKITSNISSLENKMDKESLEYLNENCKIVDSTNYDLCLGTFSREITRITNEKTKTN